MSGTGAEGLPAFQQERSDMIREALAAQGDDGTRPRNVLHYVFPDPARDPAGDARLIAALARFGVAARLTASAEGLILEHEVPVAAPGFDALVAEIAAAVWAEGWYYDGWESALLPPG